MGSRKKAIQIVSVLDSSDAFDKAVEESERSLVVVDVHQNWCGPCAVMEPVFRRIKLENERLQVKFYTMDEGLMTDAQKHPLPSPGACKPLVLIYKNKVVVSKIQGVNAPELETQVIDNAPEATEEE